MKAYVFSIGETTTKLCCSVLKDMGFDVVLLLDKNSLWSKLRQFYSMVEDDEVLRVDADIIPNQNVLELIKLNDGCWWHQSVGWDWYKTDVGPISISHMKREAIDIAKEAIGRFRYDSRPETAIWRLQEFHWPRKCHIANIVTGIHGYHQEDQRARIKKLKAERNQPYNWELVKKIEAL